MQWVLLFVIVVSLLFLARYYPKVAFSIMGTLIIGAAVIVFSTTDIAKLGRSQIPTDEITIENPVISPAYAGGFRFTARFINTNSTTALRESELSITMLDCLTDSEDSCQIIGQEKKRINVKIPSGQARDISETLSFGSAKPSGKLQWKFQITETRS